VTATLSSNHPNSAVYRIDEFDGEMTVVELARRRADALAENRKKPGPAWTTANTSQRS
jgi:hypothetical protein